jgi:hypothetical protein
MKRLFWPILVALLSVSCIEVEDFGGYWDKGVRDPALEGRWRKLGVPGEDIDSIPCADTVRFVSAGKSHSMHMINPVDPAPPPAETARQKLDNEESVSVRSLKVGRHSVLMMPSVQSPGLILRYEVAGTILREYVLNVDDAFEARLKGTTNFVVEHEMGEYPVIKHFDDEVFRILSGIADDPSFWTLLCEYKKESRVTPNVKR